MKISLLCFTWVVLCVSSSLVYANEYDRGYQAGYQDAMGGVEPLCVTQRCRSADDYERGYKLGYRTGARERKQDPSAVYPLIDSPGKTIGSDFNGDGIHDVVVGARAYDIGASNNNGAAYIFFGASNLSGTKRLGSGDSADVTIVGKAANDFLGHSVSSAGDVNGDGFDDILVGAYGNGDAGSSAGAIYLLFGTSTLSGTKSLGAGGTESADMTILGKTGNGFGKSVSDAGDVNGDGFDDILVGAEGNDDGAGANNNGAAYLFFGASNLSGTKNLGGGESADVTILGKAASDNLGRSISGAGDINGDGFDDLLVGTSGNDDGGSAAGAAYIIFGASNLSGTKRLGGGASADVTVLGKVALDQLGVSVSGAGDVNGDGFPDVIVGASTNDDAGSAAGAAYILFGASNLSGTKDTENGDQNVTILGKALNHNFGSSVGGGRSNAGP